MHKKASKAGSKSEIPDAVAADAKHYTVVFENDFVRVLRIHCGRMSGEICTIIPIRQQCSLQMAD